jgi:hypothetical protein
MMRLHCLRGSYSSCVFGWYSKSQLLGCLRDSTALPSLRRAPVPEREV